MALAVGTGVIVEGFLEKSLPIFFRKNRWDTCFLLIRMGKVRRAELTTFLLKAFGVVDLVGAGSYFREYEPEKVVLLASGSYFAEYEPQEDPNRSSGSF